MMLSLQRIIFKTFQYDITLTVITTDSPTTWMSHSTIYIIQVDTPFLNTKLADNETGLSIHN